MFSCIIHFVNASTDNAQSNTANRQIARAAGVVMAGFVLSNLTSLARTILTANVFGTSEVLDARWFAPEELSDLLHAPYHDSFLSWLEHGGHEFHSAWDEPD